MPNMTRHVLKGNEVQFAGSLQLHIDPPAAVGPTQPQADSKPVGVRIAENHAEYALVEVTCSCGRTTYVRCEYAATHTPAVAAGSGQR
jgi:hypothetical protein